MNIIINGVGCIVHDDCTHIDYEEVVRRSGGVGNPTVTYGRGSGGPQGTLSPERDVEIVNGMVFNVCHTGNA